MTEAADAISESRRLGLPSGFYTGPAFNAGRSVWSLPPFIICTTILFAVWPLFVGIGSAAAVFGLLLFCTTQCLKRRDVTRLATAAIWSSGAVVLLALALSFPPEDLGIASVIAALLGMLVILPFFSLPLALRYHRTT